MPCLVSQATPSNHRIIITQPVSLNPPMLTTAPTPMRKDNLEPSVMHHGAFIRRKKTVINSYLEFHIGQVIKRGGEEAGVDEVYLTQAGTRVRNKYIRGMD